MRWGDSSSFGSPERMRSSRQGKGKAMEDFLTSFFITPFTGLAEGIATATSPLDVIDAVDGFVWGPIMILLLLGTHIFMTIRTGFIQRKIGTGIKLSVTKDDPSNADGDITQFGALTTALAATIGTGNIVGVGHGPAVRRPWAPSSGCGSPASGHRHEVLRGVHRREVPREGPLRQDARRRHVRP